MEPKTVPNYLNIFELRITEALKILKKELEKPKKERSKATIRRFIKDIKTIRNSVKVAREEHSLKCPHCGKRV